MTTDNLLSIDVIAYLILGREKNLYQESLPSLAEKNHKVSICKLTAIHFF